MQKVLGSIRKACHEFELIQDEDRVAVAISGGKDSLVLLAGLVEFQRFAPVKYEVVGLTIDPQFDDKPGDYSGVQRLCDRYGVEYHVVRSDIAKIVFDIRHEKNPCSLCAKMRRGALHDAAKALGCNKLALGHNNDDVVETLMMNLFREGRIGCFAPKSYLSRKDITVIRPLSLAPEIQVISCCKRMGFEVVKSACPEDKHTARQEMKDWLDDRERGDKGFKIRLFGALRRSGINGWGFRE